MAKTIVFANQKGGVGKTTSCVNIGAYMAGKGKKVLMIDFDPQGNLSSNFGVDHSKPGIYEFISGKVDFPAAVQKCMVKNLHILPSNIHLTGATIELIDQEEREFFLKKSLKDVAPLYDYILIDCPPSLGILTLNGLVAAEFVLIPLQCEYFALEGLSLLVQTIKQVQSKLNPGLKIGGILFTMFDKRTNLANEVVREVTGYFKDKVFRTIIPRNVKNQRSAQPFPAYMPV
jgi:chromosome partitioning protein